MFDYITCRKLETVLLRLKNVLLIIVFYDQVCLYYQDIMIFKHIIIKVCQTSH